MCCEQLLAARPVKGVTAADPSAHLHLEPTPTSPRTAREFVSAHVRDLASSIRDTVLLLTSELVTNGVLHARTALVLGVTTGADEVMVSVADDNTLHPTQPPPDFDRPSGRGLRLLDALADEWGVSDNSDGKIVWFTVPRVQGGPAG